MNTPLYRSNSIKSSIQIQALDIRSPIIGGWNCELPAIYLHFIQNGSYYILNISLINGINNKAYKIEHYKGVFCVYIAVDIVLLYLLQPRSIKQYRSPTIDVALPGAKIKPSLP